ncbi:MAG: pyridoxal-phosphate dependent enzyme [Pyrinomonadaceae bacterium]
MENLQPTGAFKVRGGVNLVGHEVDGIAGNHRRTLITASTGNHDQSIAYAGRLFDARVIIYAPSENVNESKIQAMRDLGAEVRLHGRDFDEARLETDGSRAKKVFAMSTLRTSRSCSPESAQSVSRFSKTCPTLM